MMKRWGLVVLSLSFAGTARAEFGKDDVVPATSLLVPYFEVDLDHLDGSNTVVTVQNTSATAILTHYVLYTDFGVPVLQFNVYLTGYDSNTLDIGDLLRFGTLPRSASAGQDPGDNISNHGPRSQDINYASCTGMLPYSELGNDPVLGLRAAFLGLPSTSLGGNCGSLQRGDSIARGYLIVDSVNYCTVEFPTTAYATSTLTWQNYLVGNVLWLDGATQTATGAPAVHIEGFYDNAIPAGTYSFYARAVNGGGTDKREPLGSMYGVDFDNDNTELVVWRDTPRDSFACGAPPAWYPLGQTGIDLFDDQEQYFDASAVAAPFPAAVNKVKVTAAKFGHPFATGHMQLNLNTTVTPGVALTDVALNQAYVFAFTTPRIHGVGSHRTVSPAVTYDNVMQTNVAQHLHPLSEPPYHTCNGVSCYDTFGSALGLRPGPAATVLIPYFEVGLKDANQADTLVRINNESASSTLLNITLWTDRGVPVHEFQAYMTGYDSLDFDVRTLFRDGFQPLTGDAGNDPNDYISPRGTISQDINFSGPGFACATGGSPFVTADQAQGLNDAFAGKPSTLLSGLCGTTAPSDGIARGYITIDSVNTCTNLFPNQPGYAALMLTSWDHLSARYTLINRHDGLVYHGAGVALSSDRNGVLPDNGSLLATFYGQQQGYTRHGGSELQTLPTRWWTPFVNRASAGGDLNAVAGTTEYLVWREPATASSGFACGAPPPPLPAATGTAWDDQEEPVDVTLPFDLSTQRVSVDTFELAADRGMLQLDLSAPHPLLTSNPNASQAHITTLFRVPQTTTAVTMPALPGDAGIFANPLVFSKASNVIDENATPTATITVRMVTSGYCQAVISSNNDAELGVGPSLGDTVTVSFYENTWGTPQTITLHARPDANVEAARNVTLKATFSFCVEPFNGAETTSPVYTVQD